MGTISSSRMIYDLVIYTLLFIFEIFDNGLIAQSLNFTYGRENLISIISKQFSGWKAKVIPSKGVKWTKFITLLAKLTMQNNQNLY
jgi:hypothetical protein